MARSESNSLKRIEMKALASTAVKLFDAGSVAAAMDVTASCVLRWAAGKSMGTNSQRATLQDLLSGGAKLSILLTSAIEQNEAESARCRAEYQEAVAKANSGQPSRNLEWLAKRASSYDKRIAACRRALARLNRGEKS
jgi:hypothetical protein